MRPDTTERWRSAFRLGVAPLLSTPGLRALAAALQSDDPALCQRRTVLPVEAAAVTAVFAPPEAACAIGLCGWKGDGLLTTADVMRFFGDVRYGADQVLKQLGGEALFVADFTGWYDRTPRAEMISALLPEVTLALASRETAEAVPEAAVTPGPDADSSPLPVPGRAGEATGGDAPTET